MLLYLVVFAIAAGRGMAEAAESIADDERLVRAAGVTPDKPGLLAFFRLRTPSDADRRLWQKHLQDLGSEDFATREAASKALTAAGPSVLPLLRPALADADIEVARRARACVDALEGGPGPQLPAAAARLLVRRDPANAVTVLLAYVPFANDVAVVDDIAAALLAQTTRDRPDAALLAGLADARPAVRGVAAHVVGRKGDAQQRDKVARLLADPDAGVRYRAAVSMLVSRDRRGAPALIALLGDRSPDLAWQAEEALLRLASDGGPGVADVGSVEGRRKACELWTTWWQRHGADVDLTRFEDDQVLLGLTLAIEYNSGRVWECGSSGALRLDLRGLLGPMEAQVLPGGRVLIAESTGRQVSVRDRKGNILWSKRMTAEPTGCQRLANGNTFVSTYNSAMEFGPDGTELYHFNLGGSNAIWKARTGNILAVMGNQLREMDTKGKVLRTIGLPQDPAWSGVQELPGGRFLVCSSSSGQIVEVDATGKVLWHAHLQGACGICRLPNGRTVVGTANRVVELNQAGEVVWEKKTEGYVRRVHRR
jgi:HEAT repeat protein